MVCLVMVVCVISCRVFDEPESFRPVSFGYRVLSCGSSYSFLNYPFLVCLPQDFYLLKSIRVPLYSVSPHNFNIMCDPNPYYGVIYLQKFFSKEGFGKHD